MYRFAGRVLQMGFRTSPIRTSKAALWNAQCECHDEMVHLMSAYREFEAVQRSEDADDGHER